LLKFIKSFASLKKRGKPKVKTHLRKYRRRRARFFKSMYSTDKYCVYVTISTSKPV
jgi:hypothetical protein